MYPATLKEARKTFDDFKKQKHSTKNITTVICPPNIYLADIKSRFSGSSIFFGAQDIFWKEEGAYTGETSAEMVKSLGARFVIVGHSETRANGVNNEMVSQKANIAIKNDFHVILAIGEPVRDDFGHYLRFIEKQITESLRGVSRNKVQKLVIAYEPVWAIGKGKNAMTPDDLHRMTLYIKKILMSLYGKKVGSEIPILYGGSVNSDNASQIVYEGEVDGLLIGRASLNPEEFSKIIDRVSKGGK